MPDLGKRQKNLRNLYQTLFNNFFTVGASLVNIRRKYMLEVGNNSITMHAENVYKSNIITVTIGEHSTSRDDWITDSRLNEKRSVHVLVVIEVCSRHLLVTERRDTFQTGFENVYTHKCYVSQLVHVLNLK